MLFIMNSTNRINYCRKKVWLIFFINNICIYLCYFLNLEALNFYVIADRSNYVNTIPGRLIASLRSVAVAVLTLE